MSSITSTPTNILNLLTTILNPPTTQDQTTLIICTTKTNFLRQLQHEIETRPIPQDEIPASQDDDGEEFSPVNPTIQPLNPPTTHPKNLHPLLTPTLHLLATSRTVTLAFIPSVTALRAYLGTWTPTFTRTGIQSLRQRLTIVDILALHHDTSEFTFQGLSRTFAVVASTVERTGCMLDMVECGGSGVWDVEVPLLSASIGVRNAGGAAGWAGRRIAVRKVVERWFGFVDG